MHARTSTLRALALGAALSLLAAAPAGAQSSGYPSFQLPRIAQREFNFGFADAERATSLVFQWREGTSARNQLSLDVGLVDIDGGPGVEDQSGLMLGGQFAHQMTTSSVNMPFDLLFTAGANLALYDDVKIFRVPVGISAGRRFPIEGGLAITPYIHPRLVLLACGDCGAADDTEIGLEFDLGVDFQFNPQFSLRLSGGGFGSEDVNTDSFGVSLAWFPGMGRAARR